MKNLSILVAVISSQLLIACVPPSSQTTSVKSEAAQGTIRIGMSQSQVEQILGAPRSVYRYKGGAATTGVEELHHYSGGTHVGYIEGVVATFQIR